jgi:hypothetical protein
MDDDGDTILSLVLDTQRIARTMGGPSIVYRQHGSLIAVEEIECKLEIMRS